jgi:hypothetical protein
MSRETGEALTTKWELRKAVEEDPDDRLSCFALADMFEEQGWGDLAFCYRWMGWFDRRPGKREGERLRKRLVWYKEDAFLLYPDGEEDRYRRLPHARLPKLIYLAMEPRNPEYLLFATWEQAVTDLSKGLARVRALLQQPPERKT